MNRKLTFSITGQPNPLHTRSVMDLCDYLTDQMLVPLFARSGAKWERGSMNFFTFDNTCDPLQPTGIILFRVPPLFAGCAASLEQAIVGELVRLGIQTGPIAHEKHPAVFLLRIPITDNPTALLEPPEVNMSRTRGAVVLRDLLGYQPVGGRYEFQTADLLQHLGAVTDEQIAACTASPVRDAAETSGVRRTPSPISMRAVRRCLDEVRQFAEWAMRHNYRQLAAA